ncbi:MAG TPA: M23 family metallopeptidase [Desulfurivibrio alkaliphilus]|uniref:M23 family metallopeptidase n=1 Tax=Desulfurivibrio alkaliphilus TaxID=427923 RepID=A0A7C2XYR5_9BACT|nr:M23 family metallopeptidase [Desulfurivibrio alkaliphilus]
MSLEPIEKRGSKAYSSLALYMLLILAVLLLPLLVLLARLYEGEPPRPALAGELTRLGLSGEIAVQAEDSGRGLRQVAVFLRQEQREVELLRREFPRQSWIFQAGPESFSEVIAVAPREFDLRDGRADLVLQAVDHSWRNWLAGNRSETIIPLVIDTRPPVISVGQVTRYVRAGGSGLVRYTIDEEVAGHGVMLNGHFHTGFPLSAERAGEYLAYIGLPYDTEEIEEAVVVAEDLAGNLGRAGFGINLRRVQQASDRINVSENFLRAKLPEFADHYPELSGSYLEQYLYVNRTVREMNNRKIAEVCRDSHPERLWEGGFSRMARSSQRAGFADRRSYFYDGRKIDEQVHLGVDLASVRHAEIEAANNGIVVFAEYLGIYGNTVILDHGQGVFSLYSHLSRISVEVGQRVEQDDLLGYSGVTGMAGGDHLHFSMLVNGVFVDPVEWWDRNWVNNQLTVGR